jgi:lipid-A-disaccharide synthase
MKPLSVMVIAGEASGDQLAAELISALRTKSIARSKDDSPDVQPLRTELEPRFFGAGGAHMTAAGAELAFDLTQHSVIGISEVIRKLSEFRRMFHQLLRLAIARQPDVIIGVDYGGFNLRFAKAVKDYVRRHRTEFTPWNPRLVQFVSPQVWASRPSRAYAIAQTHDLLLSIFPFEPAWYAQRTPGLRVEFVGHPLIGRERRPDDRKPRTDANPTIVLLPGSRRDEVRRHLPLVASAFELIRRSLPDVRGKIVLPNDNLAALARSQAALPGVEIQVGGLSGALADTDLAITKSGTVTMECAAAGVPAVVFYKTSWPTYLIGRQIVSVKYLAMPNLLASEEVYPEFVQHAATPESLATAALDLLRNESRRAAVKSKLAAVIRSLGSPGAAGRAADAILRLLP